MLKKEKHAVGNWFKFLFLIAFIYPVSLEAADITLSGKVITASGVPVSTVVQLLKPGFPLGASKLGNERWQLIGETNSNNISGDYSITFQANERVVVSVYYEPFMYSVFKDVNIASQTVITGVNLSVPTIDHKNESLNLIITEGLDGNEIEISYSIRRYNVIIAAMSGDDKRLVSINNYDFPISHNKIDDLPPGVYTVVGELEAKEANGVFYYATTEVTLPLIGVQNNIVKLNFAN